MNGLVPNSPIEPLPENSRVNLVRSVKTPLAFFVLYPLIVEALFYLLIPAFSGVERLIIFAGMFVLLVIPIFAVAFIAFTRPMSLYGKPTPAETLLCNEIPPRINEIVMNAEKQSSCAMETLRVFTTLFPQAPQGIRPSEWQVMTGLIRDQTHLSNNIVSSVQNLHSYVLEHCEHVSE